MMGVLSQTEFEQAQAKMQIEVGNLARAGWPAAKIAAHRAEEFRGRDWCLCGKTPCVSTKWGGVYTDRAHPTEDEYQAHIARRHQLGADLQDAIEHALGLDAAGEQLGLFGDCR